jgi:hypothetical protein
MSLYTDLFKVQDIAEKQDKIIQLERNREHLKNLIQALCQINEHSDALPFEPKSKLFEEWERLRAEINKLEDKKNPRRRVVQGASKARPSNTFGNHVEDIDLTIDRLESECEHLESEYLDLLEHYHEPVPEEYILKISTTTRQELYKMIGKCREILDKLIEVNGACSRPETEDFLHDIRSHALTVGFQGIHVEQGQQDLQERLDRSNASFGEKCCENAKQCEDNAEQQRENTRPCEHNAELERENAK